MGAAEALGGLRQDVLGGGLCILGHEQPGGFPSRYLPLGYQAGGVGRRRRNGEKWWKADIAAARLTRC